MQVLSINSVNNRNYSVGKTLNSRKNQLKNDESQTANTTAFKGVKGAAVGGALGGGSMVASCLAGVTAATLGPGIIAATAFFGLGGLLGGGVLGHRIGEAISNNK